MSGLNSVPEGRARLMVSGLNSVPEGRARLMVSEKSGLCTRGKRAGHPMGALQPLAPDTEDLPTHAHTFQTAGDQSDTPKNDKKAAAALFSDLDFIGISAYSPLRVRRLSGGDGGGEKVACGEQSNYISESALA